MTDLKSEEVARQAFKELTLQTRMSEKTSTKETTKILTAVKEGGSERTDDDDD